jgi:D-cysteine desulfhydrase
MIKEPTRIPLARTPTPFEPLKNLSAQYGIDLRIKRDDLTGTELSGNKIRKLEYLLHDAINQNCDTVITCGAVTSNHARATAIAARRLGLDCHLILAGTTPSKPDGNLLLNLLVGATVHYITREEYSSNIESHLDRLAKQVESENKKPYIIPTGGSNAVGLWGYISAIKEIKEQCVELDWKPDYIVSAVGSGGTYAGILLGNRLHEVNVNCLGVLVCGSIQYFQQKINDDIQECCERFQLKVSVPKDEMPMVQDYTAGGYAQTNAEQLQLLRHVAEQEAIILDPVYTNKAFFGMIKEAEKKNIPPGSKVLFIHTGGIFGLSNFNGVMMDEWQSVEHWDSKFIQPSS